MTERSGLGRCALRPLEVRSAALGCEPSVSESADSDLVALMAVGFAILAVREISECRSAVCSVLTFTSSLSSSSASTIVFGTDFRSCMFCAGASPLGRGGISLSVGMGTPVPVSVAVAVTVQSATNVLVIEYPYLVILER